MKPLLLIIDLQKGWRHKEATEQAMLRAVALAQRFPGDIIHCRFKNEPNSLFHSQLGWSRFVDPADTGEIPEIAALSLPTYWRTAYSCVNDELKPVLASYSHVYIAGVFTDISVTATAMGIFDLYIPVSVVTDCVATLHGQPVHEMALRSLAHALGRQYLVTAEEVTAVLEGPSAGAE